MPLLQKRVQFWAAGFAGEIVIRLLASTWRYVKGAPEGLEEQIRSGRKQAIFGFWHRHLLSLLGGFKGYPICVPVSEHRDGEYVAQVMERFGLLAVRGSTTRGRIRLIRGLLEAIRRGRSGAITPDGPRGPKYTVQAGFVLLGRRTGLPVYPLGIAAEKGWELNSWDAFVIPKPFTRICIVAGTPMAPEDIQDTPVRECCAEFRERLMAATQKAQEELARGE